MDFFRLNNDFVGISRENTGKIYENIKAMSRISKEALDEFHKIQFEAAEETMEKNKQKVEQKIKEYDERQNN